MRLVLKSINLKAAECNNKLVSGVSVSSGLAWGRAYHYQDILWREHDHYAVSKQQLTNEYDRIDTAIDDVQDELMHSVKNTKEQLNDEVADIFYVQSMMLDDATLLEQLKDTLKTEQINAEQVIKIVFRRLAEQFRENKDEAFRSKADDIEDLCRRLLMSLGGIQAHMLERLPPHSVVVARRLLPSDTIYLSRQAAAGVVLEQGGLGSHAALLTRELGIPCVGHVQDVFNNVTNRSLLLLDGDNGSVIVDPDRETFLGFRDLVKNQRKRLRKAQQQRFAPAVSADGEMVTVMANANSPEDVLNAKAQGCDGIGLYRLEGVYLSNKMVPTAEELYSYLREALYVVRDQPLIIRLLDAGGDKRPPSLNLPDEPDPFLGLRGIRLLRENLDLLKTQLEVLAKLSLTMKVTILIPMVTLKEDILVVRRMLQEVVAEKGYRQVPPLGFMVETPAAALCIDQLLPLTDFISIGSNDLTQYTMAAGRENMSVSNYYIEHHPAVLSLIRQVVAASHSQIPVSLCGELAANKQHITSLLQLGLRSFSVAPPMIPEVKSIIRLCRIKEAFQA